MNYVEAVELAKNGNEAGFNFLYEETYKSKYYLALKYMQNEEAAKDVLQDAYIKAFGKLDILDKPERFSTWLGMIVANTAKDALRKQNPMLFTDVAKDSEEEAFGYQIEDESIQSQPETAYSQKETQELVHELIDTLPEEQRLCILMFHIEEQSISEIAKALDCSENTVKSRLNYGRKSIKYRAEELQKKGYKLYGIAPVPFLLQLLSADKQSMAAKGILDMAGGAVADNVMASVTKAPAMNSVAAGANAAVKAGTQAATAVVKKGFIHTLAGKVTVAAVGICLTGGVAAGVIIHNNQKNPDVIVEADENENSKIEVTTEEKNAEENAEEKVEENTEIDVTEEQYPELLAGGLTKEQFEFVLAYGPTSMTDSNPSMDEMSNLISYTANAFNQEQSGISKISDGMDSNADYDLSEVNNFISVLTEYQLSEEDNDKYSHINVSGNVLHILMVSPNTTWNANILSAKLKDDEIRVEYEVTIDGEDPGYKSFYTIQNRVATLKKTEDEKYRITDIVEEEINPETDCKRIYIQILEKVKNESGWLYTFEDKYKEYPVEGDTPVYEYCLYDLSGDNIPELLVRINTSWEYTGMSYWKVFTYQASNHPSIKGNVVESVECEFSEGFASAGGGRVSVNVPMDKNGLIVDSGSSFSPESYISRLTVSDGRLQEEEVTVLDSSTDEAKGYFNGMGSLEWKDISDVTQVMN